MVKKQDIREFVKRWQEAEGNEQRESNKFWIELAQLVGVSQPTRQFDFERRVHGRRIDIFVEDMGILIESKSRGVDLDHKFQRGKNEGGGQRMVTPYEQAKWYADNLPNSIRPRWVVVCNFDEIRIHDLDTVNPGSEFVSLELAELPEKIHLLSFLTDRSNSRISREQEISVEAGALVGKLYDLFREQYLNIETDPREQHSLNVLIVRLVFLLYAEDAGLLQFHQAFYHYMKTIDVRQMRSALIELFQVLNTPEDQRDPYLSKELLAFPYVNGGLFENEDIVIPPFTEDLKVGLLLQASNGFDWKGISPTIFGAAFESTLNPETRREGGMHYTSIENIHKVIDPLFLDDLKAELAEIEGVNIEKKRKKELRGFQEKIAKLTFLDPAAGSHNFLTETYISLRKLELRVIEDLLGNEAGQTAFGGEMVDPIMVNIGQFYAIEINDFAVSVGKTALWIAEQQMLEATQELLPNQDFDFLPLKSITNSHCGNALRMDWSDVLPAERCSYVIGNPPFVGYSNLNEEQSEDRAALLGKVKVLDYVACWYKKAADYMQGNVSARTAFVSTNSICQGQQVEPLWKPLFDKGISIDFAWRSFVWNSEAVNQAHVHVIIVGFSFGQTSAKTLFYDGEVKTVENINGYLSPAESVFISKRSKPICEVSPMVRGCQPTDGGNLIFKSKEEVERFVALEPAAAQYVKPFSMGADFIDGKPRYCLWMPDVDRRIVDSMPEVRDRVDAVREMRLASKKAATKAKAATSWRFDEVRYTSNTYIAVPAVSSERRDYIPIGFVANGMIPGNKLYFINDASVYDFGILVSRFHNAWMRTVTGRLKSDYNYSNTIVYNNFVWPIPNDEQREEVETAARKVLDVRDEYSDKSLADLYDPDKMPSDLLAAHKALDAAVESAYGVDFDGDEEKIVAHLFKLYEEATAKQEK